MNIMVMLPVVLTVMILINIDIFISARVGNNNMINNININ